MVNPGLAMAIVLWLIPIEAMASSLPPEPRCAQLHIRACKKVWNGTTGIEEYRCWNAKGQEVIRSPLKYAHKRLPCSPIRLKSYLKAYHQPCVFKGPFLDLPPTAITLALKSHLLPATLCLNIDRSQASFVLNGSQYTYTTTPAPAGGNARGTTWELNIQPPSTALLNTSLFPFLACANYQAHQYCAWNVQLNNNGKRLRFKVDNIAPPCKPIFTWQAVMRSLATHFRACTP